jgi:hypothetical protein
MDLHQVATGLNLTTVATIKPVHSLACMRTGPKAIYKASCDGSAEATYEAAMQAAVAADAAAGGGATTQQDTVRTQDINHYTCVADLNLALRVVISDLLLRQVLAKAKRSLRRDTRKPVDMKVCKYYWALIHINNEELPNLPPFGTRQALTQDKMIDILLHGTPSSWQNKMECQGFNPVASVANKVVDFMENIKAVKEKKQSFKKVKSKNKDIRKKSDSSSCPKKKNFYWL